jgi:hypothetical protein
MTTIFTKLDAYIASRMAHLATLRSPWSAL